MVSGPAQVMSLCLGSAGLRAPHGCAVVGDASDEDRDSTGNLHRIRETCFAHECRDAVSEVVSQEFASVLQAGHKTVGPHLCPSEVEQVQRAAGFEYSLYLV